MKQTHPPWVFYRSNQGMLRTLSKNILQRTIPGLVFLVAVLRCGQGVKPPVYAEVIIVPTVTSVVVNGGTPAYRDSFGNAFSLEGQNSVVVQLLVTFSEAVTLDEGTFTITNNASAVTVVSGPSPNTEPVTPTSTVVSGSNDTQFIITFSGPGTDAVTGGTGRIIKKGFYTLNTLGSKIHSVASGLQGIDNNTAFWTLFASFPYGNRIRSAPNGFLGDGHSAVIVDLDDYAIFQAAFASNSNGTGVSPYNVAADYNLNGWVNIPDFNFGLKSSYIAGPAEWNF